MKSIMQLVWPERSLILSRFNSRASAGLTALSLTLAAIGFGASMPAHSGYAHDQTSDYVTRAMAANPDNFKFISINGRAAAAAMVPCPVTAGLIHCTLDKLALINGTASSIHNDYDQVQVFFYPNTERPKTAVVVAAKTGLMDDSVSGERYRVSFKLTGDGYENSQWNLVQYGVQYLCSRGDAQGMWVQAGCL